MSKSEHPAEPSANRSFRCTFGPVREVDLVWPPPDEELDACALVDVEATEESRPRFKPTFGDCRARGAAPRVRALVVPMERLEPPPLAIVASDESASAVPDAISDEPATNPEVPFPLPIHPVVESETAGAARSAWLAVFFATACALVTYVEYHAMPLLPAEVSGLAEQPPVPSDVRIANVGRPVTRPPARPMAKKRAAEPAPRAIAAARPVTPTPAPTPKLAATSKAAPAPMPTPPPVRLASARPAPIPSPAPTSAPPPAAVVTVALPDPAPEPLAAARPATPVAAALIDRRPDDEADIRSTLARFRTAYSQLNASAARDVWPSVDARALQRAFQSLKSQELRFDHCSLTVTGARAQAACTGRAVYVPRIGDQSPRGTSREWTFELRKADERWTIASARTL
jgi:hypothetical protein